MIGNEAQGRYGMRLAEQEDEPIFLIERVQRVAQSLGLAPCTASIFKAPILRQHLGYLESPASYGIRAIEEHLGLERGAGMSLDARLRVCREVVRAQKATGG